jgi:hypothetical protein
LGSLLKSGAFLAAVLGMAAGQGDFRKATWGMTSAQVRATESGAHSGVSQNNGELLTRYEGIRLRSLEAQIIYFFANNRLMRAKYLCSAAHSDLNDFIRDFTALRTASELSWLR